MRDAAALWEKLVCTKMVSLGFRKGRSSPCIFWHPLRDLRTNLHGDNFVSLGTRLDVDWLFSELGKEWTVKVEGILGPPGEPDTVQSIRCLNRLITWRLGGIEYEPDPRHGQILIRELGLEQAGSILTTPGVKERPDAVDEEDVPIAENRKNMVPFLMHEVGLFESRQTRSRCSDQGTGEGHVQPH